MSSIQKKGDGSLSTTWTMRWVFLCGVVVSYGILFAVCPEKGSAALDRSLKNAGALCIPLWVVFIMMFVMNHYLRSSLVVRVLGKGAGIRGTVLSICGGIISFGPIFAWYPLLKEMKQKGAGTRNIVLFLGNRAVKPFLLPIMIASFGWMYAMVLTVFMIAGSIGVAHLVDLLCVDE